MTDVTDPAICGEHMRCGYSRCGVYVPHWDTLKRQLETQLPMKTSGGIGPDIYGRRYWGYFRYGVYVPLWDELKAKLEKIG